MKIYLAGIIGGGTKVNEKYIKLLGTNHRLSSYHYKKETLDMFTIYKEKQNENRGTEEDRRNFEASF
jgi:hypothetical protein